MHRASDTLTQPVVDIPRGFKDAAPVRPAPLFANSPAASAAVSIALVVSCFAVAMCMAGGW